ncbi:MAG: hypothetical protein K2J30_03200 [Clostridia bacterium]|nr:hypothetical protein [Clostridia bacterium]
MEDEFIYYALLIMTGLGIGMALRGYFKSYDLFDRAIIKENSILWRIPIVRKLAEKQPYYARVIPVIISIAVFLISLVIYVCFWIYPPSVTSFLGSPWVVGFSIFYFIAMAIYVATI